MRRVVPAPDVAIRILRQRFLNRSDRLGLLEPGGKPFPGEPEDLDALLRAHLLGEEAPKAIVRYHRRNGAGCATGRFRVGAYSPAPDNTTKWLCLDFDGAGHAYGLEAPGLVAIKASRIFTAAGLTPHLEISGGGVGWHLWCFFDPPIPAKDAQAIGRALAPGDALLEEGGLADPLAGKGIEIFPKQASIGQGGVGNMVWLPWWSGAEEDANLFYRANDNDDITVYAPDDMEPCSPEAVARVLGSIEAEVGEAAATRKVPAASAAGSALATPPTPALVPDRPSPNDAAAEWSRWRERALAALPLASVYGEWLTGGSTGSGWLECRDPASGSGDRTPSAGVADGTGKAERGAFHSFIDGKTISVFDYLIQQGGAKDFREAQRKVAELSGVSLPKRKRAKRPATSPSQKATSPSESNDRRPQIQVNDRLLDAVVADAWAAIRSANSPTPRLFRRDGQVVHLNRLRRQPQVEDLDEATLFGELAQVARWTRVTAEDVKLSIPSKDAARVMLTSPSPDLPVLESIITTPKFGADGSLILTPGYHSNAAVLYHPKQGFELPPVPEHPTPDQIAAARSLLLDDLLVDFPFKSESDRAHFIGALVLPFVRDMIDGCTPIHLMDAPSPGTGKGLLADILNIMAVGRGTPLTTMTKNEDEFRKKITACLIRGQPIIFIDNVSGGIDSGQLAAAITSETWSDRQLGQSRMVDLPNRAMWVITGNNLKLTDEIVRRTARIRLDAKMAKPWKRKVFKHKPLRTWAVKNRAELIHAVFVLIQAWLSAGRPTGREELASFEEWSAVIGGILEAAGIPGFLEHFEEFYEEADSDSQEWNQLAVAWRSKYGDDWISASEVLDLAISADILAVTIGDGSPRSQLIRLGKALSASRDKFFGDWQLVRGRNSDGNAAKYRLA